jgi:hypothetical protein
MATFVEINSNNIIIRQIKIGNDIFNEQRPEYSVAAEEYVKTFAPLSENGVRWIQTSINTNGGIYVTPEPSNIYLDSPGGVAIRKNAAGIGMIYDPEGDAFHEPRPYASWTLNKNTYQWEPPVAKPVDEKYGINWNEDLQVWQGIKYLENPVDENDIQPVDNWNPDTQSWDSYGTFTAKSNTITPN